MMANNKIITALFSLSLATAAFSSAQADVLHNSDAPGSAKLITVEHYDRDYDRDDYRKRYTKSPGEIRYILRNKGYKRIRFTDKNPPLYKLEACWNGSTYELTVKSNGKIKKKNRLGFCGKKYDDFGHKRNRYRDNDGYGDRDYSHRRRSSYDRDHDEYAVSPAQVRRILARRGYNRMSFVDRYLPVYKLNACRNGLRYKVSVRSDGSIKRALKIGYCSTGNRLRDFWRSPRQFR